MYNDILDWVYSLIVGCSNLWSWLITPFNIGDVVQVAPIYIIVGGSLIIGIIRAIL